MPKKDHAEIAVIIDRSGSMRGMEDVVCKGFNTFLWQQVCAHGSANLSLLLFDDEFERVHESKPIKTVPALDTKTYYVSGGTALYDALGKTITQLAARIDRMPEHEKPEKVIVAITTDGAECSSMEWTANDLNDLITEKKAEGWEFMYISAAEETDAERIGFDPKEITFFERDEDGTYNSMIGMSTKMLESRGGN